LKGQPTFVGLDITAIKTTQLQAYFISTKLIWIRIDQPKFLIYSELLYRLVTGSPNVIDVMVSKAPVFASIAAIAKTSASHPTVENFGN
jgi:hypothetical protein